MALIHVAVVGEDEEPILHAVRELGADQVVLVGTPDHREDAGKLTSVLEPLGLETEWRAIEGNRLLGTIQLVQAIAREHEDRKEDVAVNLAAADKGGACAAPSAAFVAGVEAIDKPGDENGVLPVLSLSYDEGVSEAKLGILQALDEMGRRGLQAARPGRRGRHPGLAGQLPHPRRARRQGPHRARARRGRPRQAWGADDPVDLQGSALGPRDGPVRPTP